MNSKKILFNKSTLLSLKAELLKKQEEVYEKKQLPQHKVENFKLSTKTSNRIETHLNEPVKKTFREKLKEIDTDELESCRKSKLALEKKAELYEHLSDSVGNSQLASRFLVDFNSKKQQEVSKVESSTLERQTNDEAAQENNYDETEWTEFTDCLGRTRKCLKSDIELYVKRDRELMRAMNADKTNLDSAEVGAQNETNESTKVEKPFLVQKTNDYLQSLREKWEEKERELLAKDKDIHYQDLLFDEARMHGVGYYSFSTDEAERRKQMEELIKRRQETIKAQQEAEEKRKKRDELVAARVAAARARQRARAGLPPEEPQENNKDFTTCLLEFLTQQRNEADAKAKEEEKKIKEEQEKERQKLREAYVREWDIGKEGVDEKIKKFKEMSQEEYVEQQRAKRIDEFAPPKASTSEKSNNTFDEKGRMLSNDTDPLPCKSWSDVRPRLSTPPPPIIGSIGESLEEKGLYFSTLKKPVVKSTFNMKYKNFVNDQESSPIENELSDDESDKNRIQKLNKRKFESNNVEIAPPPTYEYYGPVPKRLKHQKPFESDLVEAYAQGAKSLESKSSERKLPQHYDFTFD